MMAFQERRCHRASARSFQRTPDSKHSRGFQAGRRTESAQRSLQRRSLSRCPVRRSGRLSQATRFRSSAPSRSARETSAYRFREACTTSLRNTPRTVTLAHIQAPQLSTAVCA